MAPPRTYRAEALTLRNVPLGEADLIVTFYSRETGKIRAVAKGARRSTSRLVGHLEPLTRVKLSLARGRSLDLVSQAEVVESYTSLKENLNALAKGLYVAELVDGFGSEEHPNEPLYHLTLETLAAINETPELDLALRFFELRLLSVSGLMPELYQCLECRKPLVPERHRFSPNGGGAYCLDCTPSDVYIRPLSLRALKILRLMHRSSLRAMPSLQLDSSLALELKSILAATIQYWLDKEIRSNSFIDHLQSGMRPEVYS